MADVNLTGTATWDTVPSPAPGDTVRAGVTTPGSVRSGLQKLLNRSEYARAVVEQELELSLVPRVRLSITTTTATCYSVGVLALWTSNAKTQTTYAQHTTTSVAVGALTVATWYYFYLYSDGAGGVAMEASTTAPVGFILSYKSGDAMRRYVGCAYVYDSGAGVPLFYGLRQERGHTVLDVEQPAVAQTDGTGAWVLNASCAAVVPPHIRTIDLLGLALSATGDTDLGADTLLARRTGSLGSRRVCAVGQAKASMAQQQQACGVIMLDLDDSQRFDWQFHAPSGSSLAKALFAVVGWYQ